MHHRAIFTLFILLGLAFSFSSFERTWEDHSWIRNNSHIYTSYVVDIWDINAFDLTLDSLALDELEGYEYSGSSKVEALIRDTQDARQQALLEKEECNAAIRQILYGRGIYTSSIGTLHPFIGVALSIQDLAGIPSCFQYSGSWKKTMEPSLEALEESLEIWEEEKKQNVTIGQLFKTGVCHEEYTGPARLACDELQDRQQELQEKERALDDAVQAFRSELHNSIPGGVPFQDAMRILWGDQLISETRQLHADAKNALDEAEEEFDTLELEVERVRQSTRGIVNHLESQQLDRISSSPFVLGFIETGGERNVALAFEALQEKHKAAESKFQQAGKEYHAGLNGYIKNASLQMRSALNDYREIAVEAARIETNARQVKEEMREEAEKEIDALQVLQEKRPIGGEAGKQLDRAQDMLKKGDGASVIGHAYFYYYEAAREARIGLAQAEGYSLEQEASYQSYEEELADLLARAKTDGLDVTFEEMEFRLARGQRNAGSLDLLESIRQSVLNKARAEFSYLEVRRREVLELLSLSPEFDDIERELARKEGNTFLSNGKLDYPAAIGHLLDLDRAYELAESQALDQTDVIIRARMEKSISWRMEKALLDAPVGLYVTILLYNPTSFSAPEMEISFSLPRVFELSQADITAGGSHVKDVQHGSNTLTISLWNLTPYTRYTLQFEKQKVLAHALDQKTDATGRSDGSADIEQRISFELEHENGLALFETARAGEEILIDGLPYRSRLLDAGSHLLERRYRESDAFQQWTDNYDSADMGITARVEYDLFILPRIDLNRADLLLPQANESIDQFKIISASGEKIENRRFLGNGMYAFELRGLRANQTAQVHITLDVKNVRTYVEQRLQLLTPVPAGSGAQNLLDQARQLLAQNKSEEALAKVEEAQHILEKEKREAVKQQKEYTDLRQQWVQELEEMNRTLLSNASHPFLEKLGIRKELVEDALEEKTNESTSEKLARLQGLDPKWQKKELDELLKESWSEYTRLKEQLLESGEKAEGPAFTQLESDLRRLEVSGQLGDVPPLLNSLESLQDLAQQKAREQEVRRAGFQQNLTQIRLRLQEKLDAYAAQKKEARGTRFESRFKIDPSLVQKTLRNAEEAIKKGEWNMLEGYLEELEHIEESVDADLGYLKNETDAKLATAQKILAAREAQLSAADKEKMQEQLARMQGFAADGQYIQALQIYEGFLKNVPGAQEEENQALLILGLTAALLLLVFILYMLKQMKKPPEKKLKKLRAEAEIDQERDAPPVPSAKTPPASSARVSASRAAPGPRVPLASFAGSAR